MASLSGQAFLAVVPTETKRIYRYVVFGVFMMSCCEG